MLKAEHICKKYYNRHEGRYTDILSDCCLEVAPGEIVGLMGASGCGKSTLARILLRLIPADSGKVLYGGQDVTQLRGRALKSFRKKAQLISQRPESFFDPLLTLDKSLIEPLQIFNIAYDGRYIDEILELVKLNRSVLSRYPHQVSGGEIQRLSIARALLLKPEVLVLDEPTSMLDISVQAQVLHLLKQVHQEMNLAYLFISHDKDVISWMCSRVVRMEAGKILPDYPSQHPNIL